MSFEYQGFATLGVNLNRQKYGPLDISNVFESQADLNYYLSKGTEKTGVSDYWKAITPYPYAGQYIALVDKTNNTVTPYVLKESADGKFETSEISNDTNDTVSGFDISEGIVNSDGDLVYTYTLKQQDINGNELTDDIITGTFIISKENVAKLGGISVGVEAKAADNNATVKNVGSGADSTKTYQITGGDNIAITNTDKGFKIAATDTTYEIKDITAETSGKLNISMQDQNSNEVGKISDSILYNTITLDGAEEPTTVYNQGYLGSFYTKTKIDSMFKGLNAMVYKGTVDTKTEQPLLVQIGDTYLANEAGIIWGISCSVGDLLIATAKTGKEEDANGYLISEDVEWTHVVSGKDADTTYSYEAKAGSNAGEVNLVLTNNVTSDTDIITLSKKNEISLSIDNGKIIIDHSTSGVTAGAYGEGKSAAKAFGDKISIPKVTVNANGHVTAAENVTVTLPSTDNSKYALEVGTSAKKITLKEGNGGAEPDNGANEKGSITFANGKTIKASVTANGNDATVTIDHENVTRTNPSTVNTPLAHKGDFTVVTGVTSNEQGHITGVTTTKYTLPEDVDTTYELSGSETKLTNGVTISTKLFTAGDSVDAAGDHVYDLVSDTLSFNTTAATAETNAKVQINLEWGTF